MMFYRLANVSDDLYHTFTTTTALKRSREVIYYFYKILHKQHLCIVLSFCSISEFQESLCGTNPLSSHIKDYLSFPVYISYMYFSFSAHCKYVSYLKTCFNGGLWC